MSSSSSANPFLKWAGGKRWLVSNHSNIFPPNLNVYYEPFLGGASVFFHLAPRRAVLGDSNEDLISCYVALRNNWKKVWRHLKKFATLHSDEFYYVIREKRFESQSKSAARFIYLNRTCFNGIYRENLRGVFNVPRGTKDSVIFPNDDFGTISRALRRAKLKQSDFAHVIEQAGDGDFVFVDPPYTVRHNMNGFVKYNQKIFTWRDQIRLRDEVRKAAERGARCLVMNADHDSIRELYREIGKMRALRRQSVISGSPNARGQYTELAIAVGYSPHEVGPVAFDPNAPAPDSHRALSGIHLSPGST